MKKCFLLYFTYCLLLVIFAPQKSSSQSSHYYLSVGIGRGNTTSGSIQFEKAKNRISYGVVYLSEYGKAKNVPANFQPGLTFFGNGIPKISLNSFGISIGKYFLLDNGLRLHLKAAPMLSIVKKPSHFRPRASSCTGMGICLGLGSNYNFDFVKIVTPSLLLNPILEIPLARKFAVFVDAGSNLNAKYITIYGGGGLLFGFGGAKKVF